MKLNDSILVIDTAQYIKDKLNATVIETSYVPQSDGNDIVLERCLIDGKMRIVLIHDKDNTVIVS